MRKVFKRFMLAIWRRLPPVPRLRRMVLRAINHKFVVGVLAFIRDENDRVLLFHHTYIRNNAWGLPGGAVKRSDRDLREALKREIQEESGIKIAVADLLLVTQDQKGEGLLDFVFACSLKSDGFVPSEEVDQMEFREYSNLNGIAVRHMQIVESLYQDQNAMNLLDVTIPKNSLESD